jgi:hypothetical protein
MLLRTFMEWITFEFSGHTSSSNLPRKNAASLPPPRAQFPAEKSPAALIIELQAKLDLPGRTCGRDVAKAWRSQHRGIVGILRSRRGEQEIGMVRHIERLSTKLKSPFLAQ